METSQKPGVDRGPRQAARIAAALCALGLVACGSATLRSADGGAGSGGASGMAGAAGATGPGAGGGAGTTGGAGAAGGSAAGGAAGTTGGAGTSGAAGAPACGARGQACCPGAVCNPRATCDGTACLAADVWASEADGTFNFNGGTWTQPLLKGSSAAVPAVNALWGTSATYIVGVGASGLVLQNMGTGWTKQTVSGGGNFVAVAGANASDIWAVGDAAFAHWTGSTWATVALPQTTNAYRAIWLSGPGEGWAGGDYGSYAQLTGGVWTDKGHASNGYEYYGIWGSSAQDVYMVGNGHSIAGVGDPLLVRHYDGATWTDISSTIDPNKAMLPLHAIWGADATHIWAVGEGGNVVYWNGTLWTSLLTGAGTSETLQAVWGSGPRDVWIAGTAGVRHFDGTSWSQIPGLTAPVTLWLSAN